MTNHNGISIAKVTLTAREEKRPPVGQPAKSDRDIAFATVFIDIENTKQENADLVIEKIQIQDAVDSNVQLVKDTPEEIRLKPLENSVNDFRLTNKVGYATKGQVKAVVTYRIANQVQEIQSPVVNVDRL
ncbi:hypothetical protein IQ276_005090 [Desmonostoc muscorum LEGE 12446]|uniref:Uncharacterized protein n=1 Tax=Desmonostoc muscorum LEGE 12446 TaxID=1828758 RepID=A0A8J7ACT4_DESMC|nr:hypothetical protein [Desmonostoc muscorum]MCF2145845.1 hypothetical protein [Desmonostoc muscorum LEGE 12446]